MVGRGFRPLAGIMVLIDMLIWDGISFVRHGFRPLAGIMVLIRQGGKIMATYEDIKVSVPLRGLWFLSPIS